MVPSLRSSRRTARSMSVSPCPVAAGQLSRIVHARLTSPPGAKCPSNEVFTRSLNGTLTMTDMTNIRACVGPASRGAAATPFLRVDQVQASALCPKYDGSCRPPSCDRLGYLCLASRIPRASSSPSARPVELLGTWSFPCASLPIPSFYERVAERFLHVPTPA